MSEIVRIVSFCQPTSCCKHNAKLQQSLVCIPWRTLWFSRWWRPGTRRRQSWTTERWNTSVEEDTVTWSYKRNRQLTVYNSCATTTRVYLSVNYSFISHKPATGRVQFEILLPFIIRVIERINFVTRLPWYAVVITLLFRKEKQSWQKKRDLSKEHEKVSRMWVHFIPDTVLSSAPRRSETSPETTQSSDLSSCCSNESSFLTVETEKTLKRYASI